MSSKTALAISSSDPTSESSSPVPLTAGSRATGMSECSVSGWRRSFGTISRAPTRHTGRAPCHDLGRRDAGSTPLDPWRSDLTGVPAPPDGVGASRNFCPRLGASAKTMLAHLARERCMALRLTCPNGGSRPHTEFWFGWRGRGASGRRRPRGGRRGPFRRSRGRLRAGLAAQEHLRSPARALVPSRGVPPLAHRRLHTLTNEVHERG